MKPTETKLKEVKERAAEWAIERLADPNTVILDTETTGILSKDSNTEIVQIAITNVQSRPLFSMLLKPSQPMGLEVQGIHGISNDQVINQPIFPQIAKMIAFVLKDKHVICYNADFDWKLVVHMFKKYEQEMPQVAGVSCAMDRYSEWCGEWSIKKDGFKWQKLPNLSGMTAHDAYSDCVSTVKVLELMASKFDPSTVEAEDISLDF